MSWHGATSPFSWKEQVELRWEAGSHHSKVTEPESRASMGAQTGLLWSFPRIDWLPPPPHSCPLKLALSQSHFTGAALTPQREGPGRTHSSEGAELQCWKAKICWI